MASKTQNPAVCALFMAQTKFHTRLRGFRLTQLCFISCSLFYSNYALHVSIVRQSSRGNRRRNVIWLAFNIYCNKKYMHLTLRNLIEFLEDWRKKICFWVLPLCQSTYTTLTWLLWSLNRSRAGLPLPLRSLQVSAEGVQRGIRNRY
jgi:hypothetical protein